MTSSVQCHQELKDALKDALFWLFSHRTVNYQFMRTEQ